MTVHSFTLAGQADTDLGVELQAGYDEPVLPDTRDRTVEIPGRAGETFFGADLTARQINLPLAVIGTATPTALQEIVRAFAAILLDGDGSPQEVSLVFTKEPSKTYTVRYSGSMSLARLIGSSKGIFTLPLTAADPFAYGAEESHSMTVTTSPQSMTITNSGAQSTPCVITVTNNGSATINGFTISRVGV